MRDAAEVFQRAVHEALGGAPELIEPGRLHRFSTSGKRGDTSGWCRLFDDLRGGVFGCYRQGVTEMWTAADRATMTREQRAELARQVRAATTERAAQQRQQWAENAQRIARLWAECVPLVPGDPVTLYLKGRGLGGVWPLPDALRYHRALPYWHGAEKLGTFTAMVAPLVAPDGRTVALHRTYLTRDGRKAEVPTVKKLTGAAGPLAGACIPLHPIARAHGLGDKKSPGIGKGTPTARARVSGIAEGIETALASWCASGVPTVAAYCASNLAAWRWPAGLQRLVIFADNDKAGREAADTLRARALAARLRCEVLAPVTEGADWCDVWAERGALLIDAGAAV